MYCPKCGKECNDNAVFCPSCGTALSPNTQSVQQEEKSTEHQADQTFASASEPVSVEAKKSVFSPKTIGIFGVVIAAIVVVAIIFTLHKPMSDSKFTSYSPNSIFYYTTDDARVFFTSDGNKIGEIENSYTCVYSSDHSNITAYDDNQNLKIITSTGITDIGIYSSSIRSLNGKFLIYCDDDGDWNWYDIAKNEKNTISGIGRNDEVRFSSISPDGSASAFYTYDFSNDDIEGFSCLYGQAPVSLGLGIAPVAISNGAEYIYYCTNQKSTKEDCVSLYVSHNGNKTKLTDSFNLEDNLEYTSLIMNSDGNQLIFSDNYKSYITINGGKPQKLLSEVPFLIEPKIPLYTADEKDYTFCVIYPISNLLDQCYEIFEGPVYYIDKKGESYKLTKGESYSYYDSIFQIASDNSSAVYLSEGELFKITDFVKGTTVNLTSGANADNFTVSNDLSAIYYLEDNELYYLKEGKKPVKIKDDVEKYILAPDGLSVYVLSDSQLYIAKKEKIKPVEGLDEVRMGEPSGNLCWFYQGEDRYMSSASKLSPKKLPLE